MSIWAKTILVTGASRGLGLEFVRQLLELPTPPEVLIAACRDPEKAENLQRLAKSNRAVKIVKLDVEKDDEIDKTVEVVSNYVGERGLNLLINNAGILYKQLPGNIADVTREIMQKHFSVNVTSQVMMSQKCLPLLLKASSLSGSNELSTSKAAVIMISAIRGSQTLINAEGPLGFIHYKCSKTALDMATVLLARELRDVGILVTALHPGWVKTDMGSSEAPLGIEESIRDCLQTIGRAGEESNGKLIDLKGNILPY
ncbi:C-factor-like [Biomphalaria glabrata]|uniref:C-factor-like n=1 Tax=Biomphalaria glabrata TaxID=6526 RepID=A0A9W2YMX3_BIOGL|nr:C-factor-like [Biomphalaria glabrata]